MRTIFVLLITVCAIQISVAQTSHKVYSKQSKSYIIYSASHPLHNWEGKCTAMKAIIVIDENNNILQSGVTANVSSFNSKNANRDSHMMEVTEAIKYPTIKFISSSITQENDSLTITGKLEFHGVALPITSKARVAKSGKEIIVDGNFQVKMSDYKIENPSLLGIDADDELKISYHIVF